MQIEPIVDAINYGIFDDDNPNLNDRQGVFRIKHYDYIGQMEMVQADPGVFFKAIIQNFDLLFNEKTLVVPANKYIEMFVTPVMYRAMRVNLLLHAKVEDLGPGLRYGTRHVRVTPI